VAARNGGLILVAENDGPVMSARIGIMRALTVTLSAFSSRPGRKPIGASASWRETN
jgi:hypothetical protein